MLLNSIALNKSRLKSILKYLHNFYTDHLSKTELFLCLLFVAGFAWINYGTPYIRDIKEAYLWTPKIFLFYFIMYSIPLAYGYLIQLLSRKNAGIFKKRRFMLMCFFAVLIFSLRGSAHVFGNQIWPLLQNYEYSLWLYNLIFTTLRGAIIFVPLWLFWYMRERNTQPFYGFSLKDFNTRPYFLMLLFMLPLIVLASTQSDFLGAYPRGNKFDHLSIENTAHIPYFLVYELFYGADFLSIEFFFRGFMVLAFVAYAGPKVILPMALFYVVIHMGKPAGELISSFFGGTILGIITYYSKSIVGGIIVHIGIAWMMEIGALVGNYFNQ